MPMKPVAPVTSTRPSVMSARSCAFRATVSAGGRASYHSREWRVVSILGVVVMRVLVTGATGYIGGRLVPLLLEKGYDVTVLVRDPRRAVRRAWSDEVEIRRGDLLDLASLEHAFAGVDTAYYLVHSMYGGANFAARDRE